MLKAVADRYVMQRERDGARPAGRSASSCTSCSTALDAVRARVARAVAARRVRPRADDAARLRVVVDQVASLTDTSALAWHARLVAMSRRGRRRGRPTRSAPLRGSGSCGRVVHRPGAVAAVRPRRRRPSTSGRSEGGAVRSAASRSSRRRTTASPPTPGSCEGWRSAASYRGQGIGGRVLRGRVDDRARRRRAAAVGERPCRPRWASTSADGLARWSGEEFLHYESGVMHQQDRAARCAESCSGCRLEPTVQWSAGASPLTHRTSDAQRDGR